MKVAKWGNTLAIRLPFIVVKALGLKEGDEIEIHVVGAREFGVARKPSREAFLNRLRAIEVGCREISSSTGKKRMPGSFFDTNILVSLASDDAAKGRAPTQVHQASLTAAPDNADRNACL
jgi:antitoxin MazE